MKNNYPNLDQLNRISAYMTFLFPKKQKKSIVVFTLFLLLFVWNNSFSQSPSTFTTSGTWICPRGVNSIQVEAIGGGAGGRTSGSTNGNVGGGGGGGAYAKRINVPVVPGTSYTITVGDGGAASTAGSLSTATFGLVVIRAAGGSVGAASATNTAVAGGLGGTVLGSLGDIGSVFAGGNGGSGWGAGSAGSGGGGGSAAGSGGTANNGGNATGTNAPGAGGGVTANYGGAGGAGGNNNVGAAAPTVAGRYGGGGGGGGHRSRAGGAGQPGVVIITFTCPNETAVAGSDQVVCTTSATLAGNAPTSPGLTGLWTKISGAGTITTPSSPTSGVTGITAGTSSVFRWTIDNGRCGSTFDEVTITSLGAPITPSPATAATNVCYSGFGAITSVSWAAVAGATSYDIYFGAGSLPGTLTANVGTNSYSTPTLLANTTYHWRVVPRNTCGTGPTSATWTFTTKSTRCYCIPTGSETIHGNGITRVVYSSINNSTTGSTPVYNDYSTTHIGNAQQGSTMPIAVTTSTNDGGGKAKEYNIYIYVDWNNDGDFVDAGENPLFGKVKSNTFNGTIPIALTATLGYHTMRIGIAEKKKGGDNEIPTPCYTGRKVAFEDYTINVTAAAGCASAPTVLTNPANVTVANGANTSFTGTFGNLPTSYFWEVSTDGGVNYTTLTNSGVYTNSTTTTLNLTGVTAAMNGFMYRITASNACGSTTNSSVATLTISTAFCFSTHAFTTHWISRVFTDGNLKDTSHSGSPAMSTNGYGDYKNIVIGRQSPGGGLNISFELGSTSAGPSLNRSRVAAWVDWNGNNVFDAAEKLYTTGTLGVLEATFGIVVPDEIQPGNYRLRIRTRNTGEVTDPCTATGVAGETEDYTISIVSDCAAAILSVTNGETCGVNNPVTIIAEGLGGTTEYRWYTTPKGGTAEAVTTTGTYSPTLSATRIYYVTAFNGSCESLVRTRVKATITPAANIIFNPAEPKTCEEETIITISAESDFTEIELFYEDFESATIGLTATMPYSYSPGADSPWQVKTSTYQPTTTDAWKPATNSGAVDNLFGFSTSDYNGAKIQTRYTTTSSFDSTDFVSLTLDFSMYFSHYGRSGEDFKVQISEDGVIWNDLATYTSDQGFATLFKTISISVPNTYLDKTTLSLRFQYTSGDLACSMPSSCGWSDGVAIDDIRFYGIKELNTTFVWSSPPEVPVSGFLDQACTIPYEGELLSKIYLRPTLSQLEATQFPITVVATLGNGCPITQVIDVINNARVWKGLDVVDATTWNDVDNWKPASVPTLESCVIIPTNSIVKGTNFQGYAKNLVVKPTGNLNVLSGNSVTVKEWVHVDTGGVFELENTASLVQIDNVASNNNVGEIIYKRNGNVRRYDYIYFSSPVEDYGVNSITQAPLVTGPIYKWNPTVANPNGGEGNWDNALGDTMVIGKGYTMRSPNSFPLYTFTTFNGLFTGKPNNGIITIPVSRGTDQNTSYHAGVNGTEINNFSDNWNLVGNPYPSSIRGSQFLFDNRTKIEGNLRIWTHSTLPSQSQAQPFYGSFGYNYTPNDYLSYNFTGTSCCPLADDDIFVGAGQGFFIQMKDGPATTDFVTFNNTTRGATYTNSFFFKDANQTTTANPEVDETIDVNNLQRNRYWLDLVNPANQSSRILIGNIEGATNDRDSFYDANAEISGPFTFYSLIGIAKFFIQGRAMNFDILDEVYLGIKTPTAGNYSIAITAVDGYFVEKNIYIRDMLLDTIHDLKSAPYQFTSAPGQFDNRFKIVYQNAILNNQDFDYDNSVKVATNDVIEVQSTIEPIDTITVFDILGRTLSTYNKINANEFTIRNLTKTNTTLLMQIKLENGVIVNEKIIY